MLSRDVVVIDRRAVGKHAQVIGLTGHARNAHAFVRGRIIGTKALMTLPAASVTWISRLPDVRPIQVGRSQRTDLTEVNLEVQHTSCLGHKSIPIFIGWEAEVRIEAWVDRRIDIDRTVAPQVSRKVARIVELERVMLEDNTSPPLPAIGCATSTLTNVATSGSALPGPTVIVPLSSVVPARTDQVACTQIKPRPSDHRCCLRHRRHRLVGIHICIHTQRVGPLHAIVSTPAPLSTNNAFDGARVSIQQQRIGLRIAIDECVSDVAAVCEMSITSLPGRRPETRIVSKPLPPSRCRRQRRPTSCHHLR